MSGGVSSGLGNRRSERSHERARAGAVLAYGEKRVKLERYAPVSGAVEFDLEQASPELEADLLKAVRGSFTPYARQDLVEIAERACAGKMS